MPDFLLELLSEEIPARMQERARADLARLFADEIGRAGLKAERIETFSTPRRLALIARGLPAETEAVRDELKGPRASAPPQALEGFLRKTGLTREQLTERDGVLFAVVEKPGRATSDVLAEAVPAIVRAFPWPKSMRWGEASVSTESLRWVRPLQGVVALLGEAIVDFEIAGVPSGAATVGHRFHHPGKITIGSAGDYAEKLRACHVIVDHAERRAIIAQGARAAAEAAGLTLVEDEGLLVENAGLTEWPVPLLGRFDPAFLQVPREVIQLTMRTNQKYFACVKSSPERGGGPAKPVEGAHLSAASEEFGVGLSPGQSSNARGAFDPELPLHHPSDGPPPRSGEDQLAPAFVCVANIDAKDGGGAIVEGNQKVLAARLSDAKFFWEHDLKIRLEEQARKLDQIVFHEKLGTVADKVERVAKLAKWLVEEGIVTPERTLSPRGRGQGEGALSQRESSTAEPPHPNPLPAGEREQLAALAETAARLCKADLVTGMVGEFPELQGVMGGYYARAQGYPAEVADAIRDHYKPVGQGDEVPTAPVTVAVSLADKLDSLVTFFGADEQPTGSRDPFALRRAALSALSLIVQSKLRLGITALVRHHLSSILEAYRADRRYVVMRARGPVDHEWTDEKSGRDEVIPTFHVIRETAYDPGEHDWGSAAELPEWQIVLPSDLRKDELIFADEIQSLSFFWTEGGESVARGLHAFLIDRLKVQQREAGVRHDLIDAVFALGGEDDLVRLLARVKALQAFVGTEDGANLLVGYRRAANILKKEGWTAADAGSDREPELGSGQAASKGGAGGQLALKQVQGDEENVGSHGLSYTPLPEETALIAALDSAGPLAAAAVRQEDFEGAMTALASLRGPIDAFFDKVTVNDADPAKREARLALLARIRDAVHQVADFSRIEG